MDKAGETLASSSLSLPLATLCILTQAQAALKVKVLCWMARLLPLSLGPSHYHTFYLTIDWPCSLPPAPHIPCDTHPHAPTPHPHPHPRPPPPNQAWGGLVMQLERMFFIWTLPHTSASVYPLVFIPSESVCVIILFNHHALKKKKQDCNTALPWLASHSMCDSLFFFFLFLDITVEKLHRTGQRDSDVFTLCTAVLTPSVMCCYVPSGCVKHHVILDSTLVLGEELITNERKEVYTCFFVQMFLYVSLLNMSQRKQDSFPKSHLCWGEEETGEQQPLLQAMP